MLRRISESLFSTYGSVYGRTERGIVPSAVLLLLGPACGDDAGPCLILNKRSRWVKQPGDLCCPGGGVARIDPLLSKLLLIPGLPLIGGPVWSPWRRRFPEAARHLARMLTTGLREGVEEMRLNPLGLTFLGPLAPERLRMFRREIFPMVCWVPRQTRFHPNREVDRVIRLPLLRLLAPEGYARYRLRYSPRMEAALGRKLEDFPCFLFTHEGVEERLWGATFRIVMRFLNQAFDFTPPPMEQLSTVPGRLRAAYLTGTHQPR